MADRVLEDRIAKNIDVIRGGQYRVRPQFDEQEFQKRIDQEIRYNAAADAYSFAHNTPLLGAIKTKSAYSEYAFLDDNVPTAPIISNQSTVEDLEHLTQRFQGNISKRQQEELQKYFSGQMQSLPQPDFESETPASGVKIYRDVGFDSRYSQDGLSSDYFNDLDFGDRF